jgi:hypothetical protein
MKIKIGKKGLINEGDMKGWYIRVDDDYKNTGGFLIFYNSSPDMSSGMSYDDWVENESSLKDFFEESSWTINWTEE